jgi:hypothetical protein
MPASGNETPTGDSAPSFDFLREHDDGSRTRWPMDPDHDSATDMLPPEDNPEDTPEESEPASYLDAASADSGSSIHKFLMAPRSASPESDTEGEPEPQPEPIEPPVAESASPENPDAAAAAIEDADAPSESTVPADTAPVETVVLESPVQSAGESGGSRSNLVVVGLASYASAVTLALLYLLFQRASADPSLLESLPDVPPLQEGEVRLVPIDADMPPGHTLMLGESQRFGNIVVEPLRVVREPLAFAHYSGREDVTRPDTEPVVKLWVRFTNVSDEQAIAPLDGEMLFKRIFRPESGQTQANQFVCSLATKRDDGEPVFIYDYSPTDEFDLVGQDLGRVLPPGESYETYIPTTEEAIDSLNGELVWRMHFRKGYSPKGLGVTTVVEVEFDQRDIEVNSAAT